MVGVGEECFYIDFPFVRSRHLTYILYLRYHFLSLKSLPAELWTRVFACLKSIYYIRRRSPAYAAV